MPERKQVWIEPEKVRDYLLSKEHPVGRFKAAFFEALGYLAADWGRLESDLRQLAASGDATVRERTQYDQKYEIRGTLHGPSDRDSRRDDLDCQANEETPRFITAFPGEK